VVDALNGRAHELHVSTISMYMTYLKNKEANPDHLYLQIKENLQQKNSQQKFKNYELKEDGILLYKGKVYVPNSTELKNILLREMHNVPYVGHSGYKKPITAVRSQYFWTTMKKEVANSIV
jgi:hypothetical protein